MLLLGVPLFFVVSMFLPAGTWAWRRGWFFVVAFTAAAMVASMYLWRVNPEIYVARTSFHKGTKSWDKFLIVGLGFSMAAIFPVAALDDVRFH